MKLEFLVFVFLQLALSNGQVPLPIRVQPIPELEVIPLPTVRPPPPRPPPTTPGPTKSPIKEPKYVLSHPKMFDMTFDFVFWLTLFETKEVKLPVVFEATVTDYSNKVFGKKIFTQFSWGAQPHIFRSGGFETSEILKFSDNPVVTLKFLTTEVESDVLSSTTQVKREYFIFCQTDKAIYKPGQDVKSAIVALDSDLNGLRYQRFNLKIKDPSNSVLQEVKNAQFNRYGMYDFEFTLSTFTVLGEWTIEVTGAGKNGWRIPKTSKTFDVEFYVLPNIEVDLVANNNDGFFSENRNDKMYLAKVSATYTFGKSAAGVASITLTSTGGCNFLYDGSQKGWEKRLTYEVFVDPAQPNADGVFALEGLNKVINGIGFGGLFARPSCDLQFDVKFEEGATGRIYEAKNPMITIYRNSLAIEALETNVAQVKPGISYTAFFQVVKADGSPLGKLSKPKNVKYQVYLFNEKKPSHNGVTNCEPTDILYPPDQLPKPDFEGVVTTDASNLVSVVVDNIPSNTDNLFFRLELEEKKSVNLCYFRSIARGKSGRFIQIEMDRPAGSPLPVVGEIVNFKITLNYFAKWVYFVLSENGQVVEYVKLAMLAQKPAPFSIYQKKIRITQNMAPRASALAWTIEPSFSEMLADQIQFDIDGLVRQDVKGRFNPAHVEPGESTKLSLRTTDRASYIMILAIDKRVRLLKSGNQITLNDVLETVAIGEPPSIFPFRGGFGFRPRICFGARGWCPPIPGGGGSVTQTFSNAKMKVYSNILEILYPPIYYRKDGPVPEAAANFRGDTALQTGNPQIRKNFPETWIWKMVPTKRGRYCETLKSPDTITTYELSAFAVGCGSGFGALLEPLELKIFKDFFVKFETRTATIKRNEKVEVKILVYNYRKENLQVSVEVEESEDFQVKIGNEYKNEVFIERIEVKQNSVYTIPLWIRPTKIGMIKLEIGAYNINQDDDVDCNDADAILAQIQCVAEGRVFYANKAVLIQLQKELFIQNINVRKMFGEVYDAIVEGSKEFKYELLGSPLGPALANLESSVRQPSGCGEQTMISFTPNVYIYKYLKAVNLLTTEIKVKIETFTRLGYANQLKYQRKDGGFSAFGERDKASSTWLTTFVVNSFVAARKVVGTFIEQQKLDIAYAFIESQLLRASGTYSDPGRVIHTDMIGGATGQDNLAAYIYMTYAEAERSISSATRNHLERVANDVSNTDVYQLALLSYAFSIKDGDLPISLITIQKLLALSHTIGSNMIYWKATPEDPVNANEYSKLSKTSIETAGYALLALLKHNKQAEAFKVARWLMTQRNSLGGFRSTQDTVVGLKALAAISEQWVSGGQQMKVKASASYSDGLPSLLHQFQEITEQNSIVLQTHDLPIERQDLEQVTVTASGSGVALFQLAARYNLYDYDTGHFHIKISVSKTKEDHIQLHICLAVNEVNKNGMIVSELGVPTGFQVDLKLTKLKNEKIEELSRTEVVDSNLVMYFYDLPVKSDKKVCVYAIVRRIFPTEDVASPLIAVYSYYDPLKMYKAQPIDGSFFMSPPAEPQPLPIGAISSGHFSVETSIATNSGFNFEVKICMKLKSHCPFTDFNLEFAVPVPGFKIDKIRTQGSHMKFSDNYLMAFWDMDSVPPNCVTFYIQREYLAKEVFDATLFIFSKSHITQVYYFENIDSSLFTIPVLKPPSISPLVNGMP